MKSDKTKVLFDAITSIDEDLIDEAASPSRLHPASPILRVAAIAAVIALLMTALLWPKEENYVTGSGMLQVYAHDIDANGNATIEKEILEEGVKFTPNVHYDLSISYHKDFPFTFSVDKSQYPGMDITLEVSTDAGIFYKNKIDPSSLELSSIERTLAAYHGQHFTVPIDTELYWNPHGFDYEHLQNAAQRGECNFLEAYKPFNFSRNPSFFDIIIRANDLIVGYCVIEIREVDGVTGTLAQKFCFEVLEIVSFPMVDGYWQNVTLKYVKEQIEQIHLKREAIS